MKLVYKKPSFNPHKLARVRPAPALITAQKHRLFICPRLASLDCPSCRPGPWLTRDTSPRLTRDTSMGMTKTMMSEEVPGDEHRDGDEDVVVAPVTVAVEQRRRHTERGDDLHRQRAGRHRCHTGVYEGLLLETQLRGYTVHRRSDTGN